ncbi:MAG: hypothetical protein GWN46_14975, partial [Gammaproteobacteria bacterium]|nr:hypothetical protein [Gammaproteobacteria bacterium]
TAAELVGATPAASAGAEARAAGPEGDGDYMAPWIDTEECTACDECTNLNPKIFVYNENKKAI